VTQYGRSHNKVDGITLLVLSVVGLVLTVGLAFTIYGMAAFVLAILCLGAGIERLGRGR
jgi:hypothetical protein